MSIKENYAVNHRLVTDLSLVISGWLKVDRRSGTRINVNIIMTNVKINNNTWRRYHKIANPTTIYRYTKFARKQYKGRCRYV